MWAALRSDLTEFVSNVAEESTSALNAIDENIGIRETDAMNASDENGEVVESGAILSDVDVPVTGKDDFNPAEEEAAKLREMEETYLIPLVSEMFEEKWGKKKKGEKSEDQKEIPSEEQTPDADVDANTNDALEEPDNVEIEAKAEDEDEDEEEIEMVQGYDEIELEEIKLYLSSFEIESRTEDISHILERHESTKAFFENLVPTEVSYNQFWIRYFYRCDPVRIEEIWRAEEEEREKRRQARAEAIRGGITSVKNLFGGVGNVVRDAVSNTVIPQNSSSDNSGQGLTGSLLSGGRPPFVMNTAVSDDEEEEEELGWDSDEDDEDYEDDEEEECEYEEGPTEDEIVFSSSPTNNAIMDEERNQLQETIEMQKKEIAHLNEKIKVNPDLAKLDTLEMALFEKDAEIAALKANIDDNRQNHQGADPSSVQNYTDKMEEQRLEIEALTLKLSKATEAMASMQVNFDSVTQENNSTIEQNKLLHEEIEALETLVTQLKSSNENQMLNDTHIELPKDLKQGKEKKASQEIDSLPSSLSSCVKVSGENSGMNLKSSMETENDNLANEIPDEEQSKDLNGNGSDEEDEWGDSWGDEDL